VNLSGLSSDLRRLILLPVEGLTVLLFGEDVSGEKSILFHNFGTSCMLAFLLHTDSLLASINTTLILNDESDKGGKE